METKPKYKTHKLFTLNMSNQPDHQSRGHAEFSPSSLKYVASCAGYEGREGTSAAAEMGTRIHEALEIFDPSILFNEEEHNIYEQIVKMEQDFMTNFDEIEEELNEIQVEVALDGTATWGTCDRFLILKGGERAVMADYKTGISIIDPPDKNWQAKAYTVGAFQKYPDIKEIVFAFYVPQHNATLAHVFKREDLPTLVEDLSRVIKAGEEIRPKWKTGTPEIAECTPTQYCRFCKYEDACPALGGLVISVAKKLDTTLPDIDPTDVDNPARLSELYNIAKIVENWAASIKRKTLDALKEGEKLDGLKLRSMGRVRKISDNVTFVKIAEKYEVDLDTLLNQVSFPLAKVSKKVDRSKQQDFYDDCENAGIIETSDERHCVASQ
jgi:CRISPR/Cas system-associated exonuclease Cas4 (RecB family)